MEIIKVWSQMFFDDGSVTQGDYVSANILDSKGAIMNQALKFLHSTNRKEGILMIWGAGNMYIKKAKLLLSRSGPFKGSETLRLTNF